MANTVPPLVLRIPNGAPLTPQQGDGNLTILVNVINALLAQIGVSLNPDGTLTAGALNNINQIANLSTFSDAFNAAGTLPTGVYTTGVYAVTAPAITAFAAGTILKFKADTSNTGAAQVKVNALTNQNIFKADTSALTAGDILAGDVVWLVYDGTNFQLVAMTRTATASVRGGVVLAASTDVATGTEAAKVITPATLAAGQGVAKAWVKFVGSTAVIAASYNISGVVRNATGDYTINFTVPFATANYAINGCAQSMPGLSAPVLVVNVHTSDGGLNSGKRIIVQRPDATAIDSTEVYFQAWGGQ